MRFEILSTDENVTRPVPILFVHRAWHAAWCWENFLPYFSRQGYASCAVSLRGHGTSDGRDKIRWHSAVHGYVSDVEQVVHTLSNAPVLVGHSVGGYVVQKFLETHTAPAAVLMASVPVSGTFGFGHRFRQRHPWPFLKSLLLLSPQHMVATPALAHDSFFSPSVSADEVTRHLLPSAA